MMGTPAKHTPGPWSCQPIGDETECNILGSRRELVATVADCDARLIAAAPDLLAALQFCVLYDGGNCLGDHPKRLALARAVIARATGEPT